MPARYFYATRCKESNFHACSFTYDGVKLPTSEHHLMRAKASLMGDVEAVAKIEKAKKPMQAKRLGRQVRNFDAALWGERCDDVMEAILVAKFTSSAKMREYIVATEGPFYEASANDKIWGIGIDVDAAESGEPHNGENKLGRALDRARARIVGQ